MFLVDAQLPKKLCKAFQEAGFVCEHTLLLEDGNRTSDGDIASIADKRGATVVTKDDDFRISHRLRGTPKRLLMVSIGNCSNRKLIDLLLPLLDDCAAALEEPGMVEVRRGVLIVTPLEVNGS
jgi:predicted nuclease of predicted toxin-antitoxin system